MSVKTAIASRLAGYWTSAAALNKRRRDTEKARQRNGDPHRVDAFIDPADPYSHLLLHLLPAFVDRYDIELKYWLVGPPADDAAPDRPRLVDWSRRDAAMLAERAGLSPDPVALPAALDGAAIDVGNAHRTACGHYLGGVLHCGGETYWGIDRLHYLEERLTALGLRRDGGNTPFYPPPPDIAGPVAAPSGKTIHWYLSFRSSYTWLSAPRIAALAAAHGAQIELRFILPMVMRSLPVPTEKRRYITLDAAREARRLAIPFGKIADPVGRPVERGYSLLPWARAQGRGLEYATAFLRSIWSHGIDAGSDTGMKRIVTAAGLDWKEALSIIDNDDWRSEAEANRAELLDLGLWGAPSFRVGEESVWGQDRLWAVDAMLRR